MLPVAVLLAASLLLPAACDTVDRRLEIAYQPDEPGQTEDDPLEIPSSPNATGQVTLDLTSINGFTGEASILVFPDPLCILDVNDDEKCIEVGTFPARPFQFVSAGQTKPVTVIFDVEDGTETEPDAVYRTRIGAGAVGELVETGIDLYFRIVP